MKIFAFFAVALLLPCAFSLSIDINSAGIVEGTRTASDSFLVESGVQQIATGEMASANYRSFVGWAYLIDANKPFVANITPPNGSSMHGSKGITFSLTDYWIGIKRDATIVYLNSEKSSYFNAEAHCTASGSGFDCAYTEGGLTGTGDYNLTIRVVDNAGNESSGISIFQFVASPGPSPGPSPPSGESVIVTNVPSGGSPPPATPEPIPCGTDADCAEGYRCVSNKCAKFFDVRIIRADTPIKAGDVFDFTYLVKNPLGKNVDAEMRFWLEKNGKKAVQGSEVVFVEAGKEAEFEANMGLPLDMLGKYTFVVQLVFEGTEVFASKEIEVKTSVPLALDLHISRLPEEIISAPLAIKILVGTNFDEEVSVRLNQVIRKGNEIAWKDDKHISVTGSKRLSQRLPVLPPGDYTLTITATSDDKTTMITRNFSVISAVSPAAPTIEDIMEQKAVIFSIAGLLLVIAAILAWHYAIVIRFISPEHPARARIKLVYFTVFAIAFFLLLGFTVWSLSDLLKAFSLNEFAKFMESGYGIAMQQLWADIIDYFMSTFFGQGLLK